MHAVVVFVVTTRQQSVHLRLSLACSLVGHNATAAAGGQVVVGGDGGFLFKSPRNDCHIR
jgi:hypothetical protein